MARRERPHALRDPEFAQLVRDLGAGIRGIRGVAGLSQIDLHLKTGLSQGDLSDIELGKRMASLITLYRIARACDVDLRVSFVQR